MCLLARESTSNEKGAGAPIHMVGGGGAPSRRDRRRRRENLGGGGGGGGAQLYKWFIEPTVEFNF